jgi:nucleoside-diphosphate-sugar epimerase
VKILVTGAAGFIGTHLCRELRGAGHEVIARDLVTHPKDDLRRGGIAAGYVQFHRPEAVVHLAAQVGRQFGEDDVARSIESNATMTAHVARACTAWGARLAYCSTSEVYGDQGEAGCVEGGPEVLPHGIYGLSKRWGEEAARLYAPDGLQIVRLSMPYGPGLPAGRGRAAIVNFLWQAHHRMPVTVHRGGKRSWTYVADTVRGFRLVIERGEQARTAAESEAGVGVYNIGRDDAEVTMLDVARLSCDIAGAPYDLITEVDPPERQTVVKRLSTAKLRALGWAPEVELEEGMRLTYEVVRHFDEEGSLVQSPAAA